MSFINGIGVRGPRGTAPTIKIGKILVGENFDVQNVGTDDNPIFDFTFPQDKIFIAEGESLVGKSAYEIAKEHGYVGTEAEWLNSLRGKDGKDGITGRSGENGKSAYEIAVENGFVGDEKDWLISIRGADGKNGNDAPAPTLKIGSVVQGSEASISNVGTETDAILNIVLPQGASAFDIAVKNGYVGAEVDWINSLKGKNGKDGINGTNGTNGINGKSAYEMAVSNGYVGTEDAWMASLKGKDGAPATIKIGNVTIGNEVSVTNVGTTQNAIFDFVLPAPGSVTTVSGDSAYTVAVKNGFEGNESDWLASLKGEDGAAGSNGENGADGKSAYEIAVENGFEGTEANWLESLKGTKGEKGSNGEDGQSATIEVGTVSTGDSISVTNSGTDLKAIFDFVFPDYAAQIQALEKRIKALEDDNNSGGTTPTEPDPEPEPDPNPDPNPESSGNVRYSTLLTYTEPINAIDVCEDGTLTQEQQDELYNDDGTLANGPDFDGKNRYVRVLFMGTQDNPLSEGINLPWAEDTNRIESVAQAIVDAGYSAAGTVCGGWNMDTNTIYLHVGVDGAILKIEVLSEPFSD